MKLAVFLLAGGGIRLKPYTKDTPKCLVTVNGEKLLTRMLDLLVKAGIEKIIMVIGYKGEIIRETIGDSWQGMSIKYIDNKDWSTTNNVISLNLAVEHIQEDFMLLEGDLIFTWNAIKNMFTPDRIAVANYKSYMDGTMLDIDKNNIVKKFILKSDILPEIDLSELYKTVNIYSFKFQSFKELIVPQLETLINSGQRQVYYEEAIANAVIESNYLLTAINFSDTPWYEIDTEEDLFNAEALFAESEE